MADTTLFMNNATIHLHRHDLPDGFDLGPMVAVDTETMGLDPHRDRLCLVQMSAGDGQAHLVQLIPQALGGRGYDAPNLARLMADPGVTKLMHFARFDVAVLQQTPVVETLQALKRAGQIRAVGLSGKSVAAARMALDWADVLMVEYHADDVSHAAVIAEAAARGVGVLVKKGLASGRLPAAEAIPFVLRTPGVCDLVVGGLSLDHMLENIRHADAVDV